MEFFKTFLVCTIALLAIIFPKTTIGLAMRSVASNRSGASIVGLNSGQIKATESIKDYLCISGICNPDPKDHHGSGVNSIEIVEIKNGKSVKAE